MRIAHVNQDPGVRPGRAKGSAVHLDAMRTAFRKLGHECLPFDEPRDDLLRERLDRARIEVPLDLIYERYALDARGAHDFAREHGVPLVLEVNAPLLDEDSEYRGRVITPADIALETRVFRAATWILAISTGVAEYVLARGVPTERVLVRPNAVDTGRFKPRPQTATRRRHGIPEETFVLGFHGRLRPWHGFELLTEVFRELVAADRDVHLLALGSGPFAEHLQGLPDLPDLEGRVTLLPWLPQAECAELVACFDALPLTYRTGERCYFSPLKLLEAMACGAVPVVGDLGDLTQVVTHRRDGLVYRAGDAESLFECLLLLFDDPRLRVELGCRAVVTARGRSWRALASEVCEFAAGATRR